MKAIICESYGLPDSLVYKEVANPTPGEKEVIIEVAACAVNFPDVLIIQNKYQFKPELPFSPGGEVSGVIKSVGSQVKHLQVGQRVLALCGWGGFAEEVKVAADRVFPIPPFMDDVTAASTLYTFGTSYFALKNRAQLKSGETLLVLGASGGVGLAAVELGKVMGATLIAAASTVDKLNSCHEKGADYLINYETEDLKERVKELTKGKGVDVVIDVVGDKYAEPALRSMAWKGRYLVVGFAAGEIPKFPLNLILLKGCSVMGVFWGRFSTEEVQASQQNLMELVGMIQAGKISQHIHQLYSLEESPKALQEMMDRKVVGKAVVVVREEKRETRSENLDLPHASRSKRQEPRTDKANEEKRVFQSVGDLREAVGTSLGVSDWVLVSQDLIHQFAETTDDKQWIHVDTEKAQMMLPGGKNIAHGYLTLSLIPKLLYGLLPLEGVQMALNYGTEKVRFPAPLYSGDSIRLHASIIKVEDRPDGAVSLHIQATMEAQNSEKPVCVAEIITIVRF
ncbi:zinc-binding dehydrogenase [Mongoliitalea lutea]|uniref:Enoyl reductase (ER) domain-containing protein n=1 Tax=Mongoliitalea lutea TaxID=849756 RepID=A0A8J3G5F0_9BACT|nr:zinc-binding dehydrogenase [Mongoliitalea lutea]GHB38614.1 hypothetical protein GCM10008106_19770 [Mongoliitalea lutea]